MALSGGGRSRFGSGQHPAGRGRSLTPPDSTADYGDSAAVGGSDDRSGGAPLAQSGEHLATVTYLSGARRGGTSAGPAESVESEPVESPQENAPSARAQESRAKRASNVSMHALTRRGMSRWELEKTLTERELESHEIESELARLEGVGLIDDAALAETIVRTQHERKGLGRSALVAELRRRHIDQEHIDVAIAELDDDDELTRARELAERRAPQLRSFDKVTATRRLTGYIARKGYSSSVIRQVVAEALGSSGGSSGGRGGSGSGVHFE